jgi:hypothetical protein
MSSSIPSLSLGHKVSLWLLWERWPLSERKVVPTLTSKSTENYLSMAGATQH